MNELGKALCFLCDKELVYGATGAITILDYLQRKSHVEKYILKKANFCSLGQSTSSSTYGLHPVYKGFMLPEKTLPVNSNIPLCDRITHLERMVLSFIVEYSLPFSSFRNFVELAKKMMRNPEAANNLQVARQTAARFSQRARKAVNRQIERRVFQF